jgi:hypothetical protein
MRVGASRLRRVGVRRIQVGAGGRSCAIGEDGSSQILRGLAEARQFSEEITTAIRLLIEPE